MHTLPIIGNMNIIDVNSHNVVLLNVSMPERCLTIYFCSTGTANMLKVPIEFKNIALNGKVKPITEHNGRQSDLFEGLSLDSLSQALKNSL